MLLLLLISVLLHLSMPKLAPAPGAPPNLPPKRLSRWCWHRPRSAEALHGPAVRGLGPVRVVPVIAASVNASAVVVGEGNW